MDLRPWPVIARTTVPLASPATLDRVRPACAAAEVGSTKIPRDEQRPERRPDLVVGHLDDLAAGVADGGQDLPGTRRAVDADAFGDGRSRRDRGRVRLAGPERAGQRRARGALDADETWDPIDQPGCEQPVEPEMDAEQQRAATERRDDDVRCLATELLEDLVGEGRRPGQECRLPQCEP